MTGSYKPQENLTGVWRHFDDPNHVIIIYRIPTTVGSISYMGCNSGVKYGQSHLVPGNEGPGRC